MLTVTTLNICQSDDEVYHIGASIKDLGKKWFGFTLMRDIPASEIINRIKD